MGFHALLTRENYYDILQLTLQSYYRQRINGSVKIGYEPIEGAAEYLMNPRLGMIFQAYPKRTVRKYFYNSYNIRHNLVKNIAAKLFVFLSTHSKHFFVLPKKLYIFPASIVNEDTVFAYLNRSIRIFDFREGITISMQKESFTSKYFQNQLRFRSNNNAPFIPEFLAFGDNWFEERILPGNSLARETNENKYFAAESETIKNVLSLISNSLEFVNTFEYINSLRNQITNLLSIAVEQKGVKSYQFACEYLEKLCRSLKQASVTIPVALSHGDLQAGNIWLENEKVWIIDWETIAKRSIWFDMTTLRYSTRYYGGIKQLVLDMDMEDTKASMLGGQKCDWCIRNMISVFLLEDLLFYLEDMMELPQDGGRDSFDIYMTEVQEIDWEKVLLTNG